MNVCMKRFSCILVAFAIVEPTVRVFKLMFLVLYVYIVLYYTICILYLHNVASLNMQRGLIFHQQILFKIYLL